MTDFEIIGMLKSFVKQSLVGVGALKGAACQIQGIVDGSGDHTITFLWEDNDGESHTSTLTIDDGEDGTGIANIAKTSTSGIVDTYTITLTNGDTYTFTVTNSPVTAVDDELDSDSTNPVQNKVVTAALGEKVSSVAVNGVSQTISSGAVDLDVASNLITDEQWAEIGTILS